MFDRNTITRFPPSPTGLLHIGNVRTALYNFFIARKSGGKFIVRVEDTDRARSKKEYEDDMFDCLKWLGISFDGTPLRQSDRTEIYKNKIQELIKNNNAYISQETEGENKEVVRFKNPSGKIKFNDLVRGEVEIDTTDLKDFIIARNINEPVYHLTVVVDDMESGVTHVIRGEDHISNTPRQILLIEALGGKIPVYAHLPLILAPDKSKLSKRKHGESVSLRYYINQGYLPEAIINFLSLIGWNPGTDKEIFSTEELKEEFDISKVQKSGAIFNVEKLDWINKEHMKLMSQDDINEKIYQKLLQNEITAKFDKIKDKEFLKKLSPVIFEHISKWGDIDEMVRVGDLGYFFETPKYEKSLLAWKGKETPEVVKKHLNYIKDILSSATPEVFENIEEVKKLIFDYATENGKGEVLWPLRVALSGKEKSPDPFTLIYTLGKEESLERISQAINLAINF